MSAFTIFGEKKPDICNACQNRGYLALKVQPSRPEESPMQTMTFCACDAGKQLHQISVEFRLGDLREAAEPILYVLRECENKWGNRSEAKRILRSAITSLETLLRGLEEKAEKVENNQKSHE